MLRVTPKFVILNAALMCLFVSMQAQDKTAPVQPKAKAGSAMHHAAATSASPKMGFVAGMGASHHAVSTAKPEAQKFFDQGLAFLYAFNHDEAKRSFLRAAEIDPKMAMAWWGVAKAVGPNYNLPVDPEHEKEAYEAIQKARGLASDASPVERDYINALALRFTQDPKADLHQLDRNYSEAMRGVMQRHPDDLDAATLFAESAMDIHPWKLWAKDGSPLEGTEEIVRVLESVLKRDPAHVGANHFYIHAVEASLHPERALPSAARLGGLAPAAGHLVHMPGHIYIRTGDHAVSELVNEKAATADEAYFARTHEQGIYPMMYYTHNLHFITMENSMIGRYAAAMKAAQKVQKHVTPMVKMVPMADAFVPMPLYVMVRFDKWQEILATPEPKTGPIGNGMWHYARAMALANTGKNEEARKELAALNTFAPEIGKIPTNTIGPANAQKIPQIAKLVVEARIAENGGDSKAALEHLREAVALQDAMDYTEPPDWFWPVRETLGGALLRAHQPEEAEKVFRQDLDWNPRNPRSLFGLAESLRAQHRESDAAAVQQQLDTAWKGADTKLSVAAL